MNNKGIIPLIAIVALIVVSIAIGYVAVSGNLNLADIASYSSVYKLNNGHACCLAGSLETLAGPRYADDISSTKCSEYVDECKVSFIYGNKPLLIGAGADVCYKINSGSTQRLSWGSAASLTLTTGSTMEFVSCGFNADARKYYQWERKGSIYNLVGEENGKIFISNGCDLSAELKGKVLSGVPNTVPKGYSYCINYVTDFISVATKTYSYSGKEVICQARAVYGIDSQTFKDGSKVKIQGDKIADVECCPAESNCGTDFKFSSSTTKECTYSTECDNGGDLYGISQTTAGYFTCESGKCVKRTKSVECTSDAVCQQRHGEGYACDLSGDNWGVCINAPTGTYCGDGYCDVGESKSSCAKDCELECTEGEKLVTKTTKTDCFIGSPLFFGCASEKISKSCEKEGISWTKVIIAIFIVLAIILFFTPIATPLRKALRLPF
jgi:hypothetical protein